MNRFDVREFVGSRDEPISSRRGIVAGYMVLPQKEGKRKVDPATELQSKNNDKVSVWLKGYFSYFD
jgi:hypothetical protein